MPNKSQSDIGMHTFFFLKWNE